MKKYIILVIVYIAINHTVTMAQDPTATDKQPPEKLQLDTAYIDQVYRCNILDLFKSDYEDIRAIGLPSGISLNDKGELYGITYNEGDYHIMFIQEQKGVEKIKKAALSVVNQTEFPFRFLYNLEIFPNPFEYSTKIKYFLNKQYDIEIKVFSDQGELLKTLVDKSQNNGWHETIWDGTDETGQKQPDDWYFFQIIVASENGIVVSEIRKIMKNGRRHPVLW